MSRLIYSLLIISAGEVYIKEGFTLDYETSTSFEYIVTIKDKYHYTTAPDGNLTIIVSDANESPVWPSALDPVSVDESSVGHIYCIHESPVWPSALDPVSVDESSVGHI